eukprot:6197522-Alexandrium_andersonii.AAC.1
MAPRRARGGSWKHGVCARMRVVMSAGLTARCPAELRGHRAAQRGLYDQRIAAVRWSPHRLHVSEAHAHAQASRAP